MTELLTIKATRNLLHRKGYRVVDASGTGYYGYAFAIYALVKNQYGDYVPTGDALLKSSTVKVDGVYSSYFRKDAVLSLLNS